MFAVKGWNVQASALKTQTAPVPKITDPNKDKDDAESKKRKRGEKKAPTAQVTDANVGDLWETTIDGKKPKRDRKKQKTETDAKPAEEKDATVEKKDAKPEDKDAQAESGATSTPAALGADYKNKRQRQLEKREARDKAIANGEYVAPVEQPKPAAKKDGKKNNKNKKDKKSSDEAAAVAATAPPAAPPVSLKLTPMQTAMRQKLISARFRHLNETLYTAPSATSLDLFSSNPEMFEDYHSGFRQQVTTWPENPVDTFIRFIRERGAVKAPKSQKQMFRDKKKNKGGDGDDGEKVSGVGEVLPRTHGTAIFADLGCGDARLAQTLSESGDANKLALKIHSFDLQSPSPFVTKADISALPLADGSVDVAIFCLALMGTNWIDFIEEAYRILHWKGELWVAEIKSRFGRVGGEAKAAKGQPGKPVEHSVGSKRKLQVQQKKQQKDAAIKDERDEEEALRTEVDEAPAATSTEGTDVSGFIEVLKRRGFVLKNENSVDLNNKMFVRFEFIKAAAPVVGKNFKEEDVKKENNRGGEIWKMKDKKKFIEHEKKEVTVEDEAKVLKPCLYKIR